MLTEMIKKYLVILIVLVIIFLVFYFLVKQGIANRKIIKIRVKDQVIEAVVSDTPIALAKGLGGTESIEDNEGMLFVFKSPRKTSFWMDGMKFPLDIIWISKGKIAYIARNIPVDFKEIVNPSISTDKVLEINAGLSDKYGISINDDVKFNSR
ncbi:DUF192 domain-containing protein [Patescibacteria group bacterium]|nr:DUF192 domain-containing protein [Patescibacteria group bacterium]